MSDNMEKKSMSKQLKVVGTETMAMGELFDEKHLSNYEIDYLIKVITAKRPVNITDVIRKRCGKGYKDLAGSIARVTANGMRDAGYQIFKGAGGSNEAYPGDLEEFLCDGKFQELLKDRSFKAYPKKVNK